MSKNTDEKIRMLNDSNALLRKNLKAAQDKVKELEDFGHVRKIQDELMELISKNSHLEVELEASKKKCENDTKWLAADAEKHKTKVGPACDRVWSSELGGRCDWGAIMRWFDISYVLGGRGRPNKIVPPSQCSSSSSSVVVG